MEKKRTIEKCKYWENIAQKTRYLKDHLQAKHETEVKILQDQILNMRQEQKANKHEINKTIDELHFVLDNLNEKKTDTNLCIMELLNANVAFEKVSCVMSSVMKVCNVDCRNNIFPKKDYVSTISATRLFVSQAHAAIACSEQENQTLYTDETKKNGQPYGVFVTTNEDKKPFLLGLRQMSNKAAQTQLDVFKQILGDIELRYNQVTTTEVNNQLSIKILQNIKCTMSDRAATQVSFNQLLESYSSSMLQEHLENYHLLQEPDQMLLSKIVFNHFHKDPPEGTEHPEISLKGESSVLNAVRIASKALASGADEKNGVYLEFKTYLQRQQINKYEIKPFLGNRFNVVFHNAGAIYHLRNHIINFLEKVKGEGTPGELLPFPSVEVKKDDIWASLVSDHNDEQCAAFLIQMCSATSKALSQKVKDHLEDGQHTQYGIDPSKTFNSVLPHNKLPEFIFGHLDWLIKHRPNASRLANEAHIVYNVNTTGVWLNQQTEQHVQELINRSKLKIKDIKITEKQRLLDLKNELERISREKEEKARRILFKKCNEKKKLVEHILKLGLWDNARKVDQELTKVKFLKNKREILKTQIKFRHLVLEQPGEKTLFQVSQVNKKPVTISQLTKNLKTD
ncbi:unnamed protein product [Mytilus coruscus]|uniref:Uncharacterized protein n=1 Tax=Mytilus coruscus TaxID=42192 RepID=A0A6J8ALJ3_MYTCO|nr:unnamed protein product [Mytilus coruscus]